MADINPFVNSGNTFELTVGTSSTTPLQLTTADGYSGGTVVVYNDGPNTAFIAFGGSTAAAAIATAGTPALGMPVASGATVTFGISPNANWVAAICQSAKSATLYFTCGQGT